MLPRGTLASRAMSASEVAPNPFWYAKSTAALTSRDRLSICVLAMFLPKSVNQLHLRGSAGPVKPWAWMKADVGPDRDVIIIGPNAKCQHAAAMSALGGIADVM